MTFRASTPTVNAVRLDSVLSTTIGRQLELVESLADVGMQITARRVAQEEGDPLLGGVLGGDDEVALDSVPAGIVDDNNDLALGEGGDRLLDRGERHLLSTSFPPSSMNQVYVLGDQVELQVDTIAGLPPAEVVTSAVWGMTATVNFIVGQVDPP